MVGSTQFFPYFSLVYSSVDAESVISFCYEVVQMN